MFVSVITIAVISFAFHVADEESENITRELKKHTLALADNIATASAQYLLVRDYTSIERLLIGAAKFPGITHIVITDNNGKVLGDITKHDNADIVANYATPKITLPVTQTPFVNLLKNEMVIWQPVELSSTIGWIRISYSLQSIHGIRGETFKDSVGDGAFISLITFIMVIAFLRRPTKSLTRYTEFAERLNSNLGAEVEIDKRSVEFQKLGVALNHASRRLKRQDVALNKLLSELRRVAAMAEHSPNIVFSMDRNGAIVYSNQQAKHTAEHFCLADDELTKLLPNEFEEARQTCINDNIVQKNIESSYQGITYLWTFSSFHEQQVLHCYAADITERKNAQEQLIREANYDSLTGLPNRSLALDRLDQAIHRAHREGHVVAVMFIDLDHFKMVNDSFGHSIGDRLLVDVARHLKNCVREVDTIARLGGDEFMAILDGIDEAIHSEIVAEKIVEELSRPFIFENHEFFVGASIGITIYPDDGDSSLVLLRNADTAMYLAKKGGRNNFRFYTQELNDEAVLRVKMESYLRRAIENDELHLEYQPQICAQTGKLVGAEALVRWNNPTLKSVPPDVFIPLAEDTGLILEIGEWVLHSACEDLKQWLEHNPSPLRIAVNLSARQLRSPDFLGMINKVLDITGIPPQQLELEITEGLLIDDSSQVSNVLKEIKRLNIFLALDDFGTGYSSLSYLKRYPFDVLKIDRSFVRDITTDPDDAALCEAIIAIADSLGMKVVGEGVETKEQLDFLYSRGVDFIQGYYFSKPLKADDFARYLDSIDILTQSEFE